MTEARSGMRLPGRGMSWKELFTSLKAEWTKDNIGDVAGMVTFAGVLALFPFLLFLVALGSLLIDPSEAQALIDELAEVAPPQVTQILGAQIHSLTASKSPGLLTVSALTAIWAASGGVAALMRALNTTYDVQEHRPTWKIRGIAIGMTFVTASFAISAALIAVFAPVVGRAVGGPMGTAIVWLRLPVAGVLMITLWAMLYHFLPDVQRRFHWLTPGAIVGVALWVIASWGFSVYVSHFGKYEATYGALGGFVVLLLWMWISAQVLLLGAEINALVERRPSAPARNESQPTVAEPPVRERRLPPLLNRASLRDTRTRAWAFGVAVTTLVGGLRRRLRA